MRNIFSRRRSDKDTPSIDREISALNEEEVGLFLATFLSSEDNLPESIRHALRGGGSLMQLPEAMMTLLFDSFYVFINNKSLQEYHISRSLDAGIDLREFVLSRDYMEKLAEYISVGVNVEVSDYDEVKKMWANSYEESMRHSVCDLTQAWYFWAQVIVRGLLVCDFMNKAASNGIDLNEEWFIEDTGNHMNLIEPLLVKYLEMRKTVV